MSDVIQFKTNHGDIWLRPSAIIGVARETTHTTAMRLVDGKVTCAMRVLLVVEGVPSTGADEPRPAVDTESAALPARHSVLGAVAQRGPLQARVHHAPALRTVAHRRVAPPVVHVLAGATRA
jgi:hypothetical protein